MRSLRSLRAKQKRSDLLSHAKDAEGNRNRKDDEDERKTNRWKPSTPSVASLLVPPVSGGQFAGAVSRIIRFPFYYSPLVYQDKQSPTLIKLKQVRFPFIKHKAQNPVFHAGPVPFLIRSPLTAHRKSLNFIRKLIKLRKSTLNFQRFTTLILFSTTSLRGYSLASRLSSR